MDKQGLTRKQLLGMAALGAGAIALGPGFARADSAAAATAEPEIEEGVAWYDVQQWGVEGKGWNDTAAYYDRLPAKAEGTVRPVIWSLSRDSAGLQARFTTDAQAVYVRYTLRSASLALPHMPATGVSGIDLYARDGTGHERWAGVVKPTAQSVEARLISGVDPGTRQYTLYLPLYNGVTTVQVGVTSGASFQPVRPRTRKPIAFYGTSILQGACASRPGMAFTNILGRTFDRPTVNLGFSGNAFMEPEVVALLAELDPEVFVIDCLPNMQADLIAERGEPLVRTLRAARPDTPIVMVEDRTYSHAWLVAGLREQQAASRAAYRTAYRNLHRSGIRGLLYLRGEDLLGDDGEATTDGSHPSDLGMTRYTDAYTRVLRRALAPR